MRFQKPMFLKAIRLGKNNSDQQVSEDCMFHFPLLVILGNFVKCVLKHVAKNGMLQIYKHARKRVQIVCVRDCLSLLSTFTQA